MQVTPITETTGVAMSLTLAEAREFQAELLWVSEQHADVSIPAMLDMRRRLHQIVGSDKHDLPQIEEPPF